MFVYGNDFVTSLRQSKQFKDVDHQDCFRLRRRIDVHRISLNLRKIEMHGQLLTVCQT